MRKKLLKKTLGGSNWKLGLIGRYYFVLLPRIIRLKNGKVYSENPKILKDSKFGKSDYIGIKFQSKKCSLKILNKVTQFQYTIFTTFSGEGVTPLTSYWFVLSNFWNWTHIFGPWDSDAYQTWLWYFSKILPKSDITFLICVMLPFKNTVYE